MKYLYLVTFFLIFVIFQRMINSKQNKKIENFSEKDIDSNINKFLQKYYNFNKEGMINLEKLVDKFYTRSTKDNLITTLNIPGNMDIEKLEGLEKGIIMAYYPPREFNTIEKIKDHIKKFGWAICDGKTVKDSEGKNFKTPDLNERLVMGISKGNINELGKGGGSKTFDLWNYVDWQHWHKLTGGAHSHAVPDYWIAKGGKQREFNNIQMPNLMKADYTGGARDFSAENRLEPQHVHHSHFDTSSRGNVGGHSVLNLPKSVYLIFIIKI